MCVYGIIIIIVILYRHCACTILDKSFNYGIETKNPLIVCSGNLAVQKTFISIVIIMSFVCPLDMNSFRVLVRCLHIFWE